MFDNIYIGHSADDAKKLAEETFAVKAKLEKKDEPVKPDAEKVGSGMVIEDVFSPAKDCFDRLMERKDH